MNLCMYQTDRQTADIRDGGRVKTRVCEVYELWLHSLISMWKNSSHFITLLPAHFTYTQRHIITHDVTADSCTLTVIINYKWFWSTEEKQTHETHLHNNTADYTENCTPLLISTFLLISIIFFVIVVNHGSETDQSINL